VILPDINLLLHAYNADSPSHAAARAWWQARMNGAAPVGLCWAAMLGFVRLATHRQVMTNPLPPKAACDRIRTWLDRPCVSIIEPGPRHADLVFGLIESVGAGGNLTTDAHLAALAIEHQAELHSTDADFSRFPGLRWRNPLVEPD
jgi:toxin-antitoxin system PIN domain toxin